MTLRDCRPGADLVLRRVTGDRSRRRLAEWGLVPGAPVRLVSRGPAGGLIVALGDTRIALDSRTAGTVVVEPAR
ncbi:MAG: FeoA family protein [Micromonospora sp.]